MEAIRSLGYRHFLSVLFYRVYAVSVLSYFMQFHPLPSDLQDIGDQALSRLVQGPGNWIPQGLLTRPVVEFNLPSLYTDFRSLQKAAATRFGLNELDGALERRRALDAANLAEGAPLANLACPWRNGFIIHYICECLEWVRVRGIVVQVYSEDPGSIQSRIYLAPLGREVHTSVHSLLSKRLLRWRGNLVGAPFPRVLVDRAFKVMSVCKEAPHSTKWAVLKLWLNGWPTHRRFQRVRPCCLCGGGEDSIEHYCKCSVVRTVANTRLGLGFVVGDPLHFLFLGVVHADRGMVMRRCAFVQAVYNCTNRCRVQGLGGLDPGESLWTQVRSLFFQHRPLRACLNLWAAR